MNKTEATTQLQYVVAVDIGTTSTKVLLIDSAGQVAASHAIAYPLYTPLPDHAEQNPEHILQAVVEGIGHVMSESGVAARQVRCVSFSAAMHSLLAVDQRHEPLTACMTFSDNRSAHYVAELKATGLGQRLYERTGTPIHPMSPLLKLMWLRDHEQDLFRSAYKFIGMKEYIFAKLFNRYVIDYSLASATGLFHLQQLNWDEEALQCAGISRDQLSELVPATYMLTGLEEGYAEAMGLERDTPFVIGASDGVLANVGIGAIEQGQVAVTIGTSGAVRTVVTQPLTDEAGRLFCYALHDDLWVIGGAINNGGLTLRWLKELFAESGLDSKSLQRLGSESAGELDYDRLSAEAEQVAVGADGLLFLPYLTGARAPHWDANARGVFIGLSLYHKRQHMIRAAFEGVMFRINSVLQAIEQHAGKVQEIKASGGFARSPFWCQMLADVTGCTVTIPEDIESSAIGAAKLGLLAIGDIERLTDLNGWTAARTRVEKNDEHHAIYRRLAAIFAEVYEQLKEQFAALIAVNRENR